VLQANSKAVLTQLVFRLQKLLAVTGGHFFQIAGLLMLPKVEIDIYLQAG